MINKNLLCVVFFYPRYFNIITVNAKLFMTVNQGEEIRRNGNHYKRINKNGCYERVRNWKSAKRSET